jgi:hypothetical protein
MIQPRTKSGKFRPYTKGERYAAQFQLLHGTPQAVVEHDGFPILVYLAALALTVLVVL